MSFNRLITAKINISFKTFPNNSEDFVYLQVESENIIITLDRNGIQFQRN